MSSKRKNTPVKLSKDEAMPHGDVLDSSIDNCSGADESSGCESDESVISARHATNNHLYEHPRNNGQTEGHRTPDSPEQPKSKKQRILQSVRNDENSASSSFDSDSSPESPSSLYNHHNLPQATYYPEQNHHNNHRHHLNNNVFLKTSLP